MEKNKKHNVTYSPETLRETKKRLKALNWRKIGTIALSTVVVFALYEIALSIEAANRMEFSIAMPMLWGITVILSFAVIFLNHGMSRTDFTPDSLDPSLSSDEAADICRRLNNDRKNAKTLMLILIPFLLTLLFDFIYLFYGDVFGSFLKVLVPSAS